MIRMSTALFSKKDTVIFDKSMRGLILADREVTNLNLDSYLLHLSCANVLFYSSKFHP